MGKIIAVTSGKGGTGKTSFTAAVAAQLSLKRKRVLCVDMDVGLKNLDLSLGMSDRVMMDFSDVVFGRCLLSDAAAQHPQYPDLYLLTAPLYYNDDLKAQSIIPMVESAGRLFDFVFLDAPAGVGRGFRMATIAATSAVVVSTTDASSLRDARRAVEELYHVEQVKLVMNRVQPKIMKKLGSNLDQAMDKVGLQLLGVVPEDNNVMIYANQGKILTGKTGAAVAYSNIANRMAGHYTPLMNMK